MTTLTNIIVGIWVIWGICMTVLLFKNIFKYLTKNKKKQL